MGKFGDIDAAKAKADLNARIKAMLMLLFQMFSGSRQNTADKIHNFIPHLKRTDRDCGSLPFYNNMFTSHKTNKEHILLSMISMVVQTYWDMVDDTREVTDEVLVKFEAVLVVLEEISKDNIDNYGVYPVSSLRFSLMSKENLDRIEVETVKKERTDAEQAEDREQQARNDEAEGKQLMEAELGSDDSTTQDSPSTQSDKTAEVGSDEEIFENAAGAANGAAPLESAGDQPSAEESPAIPSATEASSEKTTQPKLVEDQVSSEDADACCGDCDTCEDKVCEKAEGEGIIDDESEPREPADDVPPMPEETKPADQVDVKRKTD